MKEESLKAFTIKLFLKIFILLSNFNQKLQLFFSPTSQGSKVKDRSLIMNLKSALLLFYIYKRHVIFTEKKQQPPYQIIFVWLKILYFRKKVFLFYSISK